MSTSGFDDNSDPVVSSVPVYLNQLGGQLYPLLVQAQGGISAHSRVAYKAQSGVVEVRTALEGDRCFSAVQAEALGAADNVLKGVVIPNGEEDQTGGIRPQPGTRGGAEYYVLTQKEGSLHLTPAPNTVVLNGDFHHIDAAKAERLQGHAPVREPIAPSGEGKVNIVTMSAKSTREVLPRLGGALLGAKVEEAEDAQELKLVGGQRDLLVTSADQPQPTTVSRDNYLDSLLDNK